MNRKRRWIAGGALAAIVVVAGTSFTVATGGKDADTPLTGSDLKRAAAAALEHTGGGTVIDSEVGDDGAAYGIEIRLDDGTTVEVTLDARFNVVGSQPDDDGAEGPNGDDGAGES